jgi:hypothetical protein
VSQSVSIKDFDNWFQKNGDWKATVKDKVLVPALAPTVGKYIFYKCFLIVDKEARAENKREREAGCASKN